MSFGPSYRITTPSSVPKRRVAQPSPNAMTATPRLGQSTGSSRGDEAASSKWCRPTSRHARRIWAKGGQSFVPTPRASRQTRGLRRIAFTWEDGVDQAVWAYDPSTGKHSGPFSEEDASRNDLRRSSVVAACTPLDPSERARSSSTCLLVGRHRHLSAIASRRLSIRAPL